MKNAKNTANIIEIFSSIQGEGPYVGFEQLFLRFSQCNLNCNYCDTPFVPQKYCKVQSQTEKNTFGKILNPLDVSMLSDLVKLYKSVHSVSLTGGEPLLHADFLKEFLPLINKKVYLETNGTLSNKLTEIIDFVDIISMDIKINSSTHLGEFWTEHARMIDIALEKDKEIFAKVVFTSKITEHELLNIKNLLKNKPVELILQPITTNDEDLKIDNDKIFELVEYFSDDLSVRVIPQVHTFLGIL